MKLASLVREIRDYRAGDGHAKAVAGLGYLKWDGVSQNMWFRGMCAERERFRHNNLIADHSGVEPTSKPSQ